VATAARHGLAGKRVLVTGASGFIGSHLLERLLESGARVTALSRTRGRLMQVPAASRYEYLACDLTRGEEAIRQVATNAPEVVFHFASHPDGPEDYAQAAATMQANLAGTLNVLEGLRRTGGGTLVFGDSCKVYGNGPVPYRESTCLEPGSSYALSKAAAWNLCRLYGRLYGLTVVSVRPTLIYGPRQGQNLISFVADRAARGETVRLDGGEQTRDPLFVRDAVEAFLAAAAAAPSLRGRVVNIGGGQERTVREIAELVVDLVGSRAAVVCRPALARPTEMWQSFCDNEEAEAMLGWRPRTSLRRGLEETLASLLASNRGADGCVSLS
jgi:dTDP-glucose 4,6-dehydratase